MPKETSKYKEEYAEQAFKLCLLGAKDTEMADFFGVTEKTINNWKLEHPKFLQSLKGGKIKADSEVSNSLYNRARGYEVTEVREEKSEDGFKEVKTRKHVAADATSAIFWLKNRQPKKWRDKQEQEITIATHEDFLDNLE